MNCPGGTCCVCRGEGLYSGRVELTALGRSGSRDGGMESCDL